MRVRVTTTALGLVAATALGLYACSNDTSEPKPTAPSSARAKTSSDDSTASETPLSSAALAARLLSEQDLGSGYTPKPQSASAQHDDVTVLSCPALNDLGSDAVTGGSLDFPHRAKAAFVYAGSSNSEVTEELYSDAPGKLSVGTAQIFDTMAACLSYQVLVGGTAVDVTTQAVTAPRLGQERWSQLLTFSTGAGDTVVKQTAIREGSLLLVVSGSPALVDRHLDQALAKATAAR
ncbi:hypothetical protein [Streptomyces sp. GQFP]|uniref:hypothetical protein n=1 Tax=Streptomyces sp. GQFP TaxID=2907545 RepID=UPI001F2D047A|nr:hypothetical protein [Streptomyces sp. GQFP]UIX34433.1 hypothetical protein LUX31_32985 [Streptomyces sp. GQFP]